MKPLALTVIVPTIDRQEAALTLLRRLEQQTITGFEVIVVDQSTPESRELGDFKSDAFTYVYHHIDELGSGNARNVGARLARGELLIFLDDDVIPDDGLVANYRQLFLQLDDSVWMLGGKILEEGSRIMSQREDLIGGKITYYGKTLKNFHAEVPGECQWVGSGNCALPLERFSRIGGFDIRYAGNAILEDADLCFRIRAAGGKVMYSPLPAIRHLRAMTGGTRRFPRDHSMYYRSHNTVYFFRKHMSLWLLPLVFLYLNAVALKNLLKREHSPLAFFYTWLGYIRGFSTRLAEGSALPAK